MNSIKTFCELIKITQASEHVIYTHNGSFWGLTSVKCNWVAYIMLISYEDEHKQVSIRRVAKMSKGEGTRRGTDFCVYRSNVTFVSRLRHVMSCIGWRANDAWSE